mmetsp:Transcript_31867/g.39151  ORF Transcript_31867/g.39151 Transcript_31867/m.39151 type:complete len:97 (+) Transcript_31867:91-381(+)
MSELETTTEFTDEIEQQFRKLLNEQKQKYEDIIKEQSTVISFMTNYALKKQEKIDDLQESLKKKDNVVSKMKRKLKESCQVINALQQLSLKQESKK